MEKQLLLASCLMALIVIGWNINALGGLYDKQIQIIGGVLLTFTSLRYLTLIIYAFSKNLQLLISIRYFYYASSIGITMLTALTVWYVIPFLKERIRLSYYLLCFLPWDVFYIYLIIAQPTRLIESSAYGYELVLMTPFNRYLSIVQGSFVSVMSILCILGIIKYKHPQIRTGLLIILLAQGLLVLDGIASGGQGIRIFKLFTITEAFALWAIYNALVHALKSIKAIKSQS